MSSVPEANRYAPPSADVHDIVADEEQTLAGRGARFGAAIIDGALAFAVFLAIGFWSPVARLVSSGSWSAPLGLVAYVVAGLAAFALMHGWLLATRGQTIGKRLVGVRIVRSDGEPASLLRLLGLRYFLGGVIQSIPFIGMAYALLDVLLIFRESRQCLHDNIADTIVVVA